MLNRVPSMLKHGLQVADTAISRVTKPCSVMHPPPVLVGIYREGDDVDAAALQDLVRAAVAHNLAGSKKK